MKYAHLLTTALLALTLCPAVAQAEESIAVCPALQSAALPPEQSFLSNMVAGSDGWLFAKVDTAVNPNHDDAQAEALARFVKQLKAHNTTLAINLNPVRGLVYADKMGLDADKLDALVSKYERFRKDLAESGALVPNMLEAFNEAKKAGDVYYHRDHHWTALGAKTAAEALAEALGESDFLTAAPKSSFTTKAAGTREHKGSYQELVNKYCHSNVPAEKIDVFTTTGGSSASSLLGDEGAAPIVVVGTSFSKSNGDDRFNFGGALAQATGYNVLNLGLSGGGATAAISDYLSSGAYASQKPKALVWEFSTDYGFPPASLLRQLTPAIGGACKADAALATGTQSVTATTALLTVPEGVKSEGNKDFIYFEASDLSLVQFTLHLTYANGKSEDVAVKRSTRTRNHGHYFMELGADNLTSVTLTPEGRANGLINTRLCRGE